MKWAGVIGITILAVGIILYEWPKINSNQKKEKAALVVLTAMGWLLGILLLFFPGLPGPTQLVDAIYKPLGKLLEK